MDINQRNYMQRVGIREFTKNFNKFQNLKMVEIIDKKTNKPKGLYLSYEMAKIFKSMLEREKTEDKKKKLSKIMQFAGKVELDEKFKNLSERELKIEIAKLKNG
ncbi:MAG: hypothetical protein ABGX26_03050 [Nautiliaceae bacterium]